MADLSAFNTWPVKILVRDTNGGHRIIEFEDRSTFMIYGSPTVKTLPEDVIITEEDEILMVTWGDHAIYNALGADHPLTLEDLIGFFA